MNGNPGIWKPRNLETQKFEVQEMEKTKILKIQIHSAQNVGKVWIISKNLKLASLIRPLFELRRSWPAGIWLKVESGLDGWGLQWYSTDHQGGNTWLRDGQGWSRISEIQTAKTQAGCTDGILYSPIDICSHVYLSVQLPEAEEKNPPGPIWGHPRSFFP